MKVRELLDVLRDYPADLEVELVVVCPVDRAGDPVEVDRYSVGAVLTWQDTDESPAELAWLVGGEDEDLEAFLAATGLDSEQEDGEGL